MIMTFVQTAALLSFCATVLVVIALVLKPVHLPIRAAKCTVKLSYCWVPLIGATLMLACGSIGWSAIGKGVAGDSHIKPYGILILFMALAYVAASLDSTGLFAWLALKITLASKGRGHLLFFLYYAMSAVMTVLTSNDVSIMTLTPIIIYTSRATKCDPMPYLVAEFVAANLWSMLLFVGNPTNIIVAQAVKMTFLSYSKFMALPTIAAGTLVAVQLYFTVRHQLQPVMKLPDIDPSTMLTDKFGAWFGSLNIAICLTLLALAPALDLSMWLVTLTAALLHGCYNLIAHVAFDPVAGRWLGWKMILHVWQGRWVYNTNLRPSVPYAATTESEREADAILTAGLEPAAPDAVNSPAQKHKSSHSVFNTFKKFTKSIKSYSMGRKYHRSTSSSSGTTAIDEPIRMQRSLPIGEKASGVSTQELTMLLPSRPGNFSTSMSHAESASAAVTQNGWALPSGSLYMQRAKSGNAAVDAVNTFDDSVPLLSGLDYERSSAPIQGQDPLLLKDASPNDPSAHQRTHCSDDADKSEGNVQGVVTGDADHGLPAYAEVVKGGPRYTGSRKALALAAAAAALWDCEQPSLSPSPEHSGVCGMRNADLATDEASVHTDHTGTSRDDASLHSRLHDMEGNSMHLGSSMHKQTRTGDQGNDVITNPAAAGVHHSIDIIMNHSETCAPPSNTGKSRQGMRQHDRPHRSVTWGETSVYKSRHNTSTQLLDDTVEMQSVLEHSTQVQHHASLPVTYQETAEPRLMVVQVAEQTSHGDMSTRCIPPDRSCSMNGELLANGEVPAASKVASLAANRPAVLQVPEFLQGSIQSNTRPNRSGPDGTTHQAGVPQQQQVHPTATSPYRSPILSPEASSHMYRRQYSSRTSVSCGGTSPDMSPGAQHAQLRSSLVRHGSDCGAHASQIPTELHGSRSHMHHHVHASARHSGAGSTHWNHDPHFSAQSRHERSGRRVAAGTDTSRTSVFAQPGYSHLIPVQQQQHRHDSHGNGHGHAPERQCSGPGDLILASRTDVDKARKERMLSVATAKHQDSQSSGQESPATVHSPSGVLLLFPPRRGLELDVTARNSADHIRPSHASRLARLSGALRASLDIARSRLQAATNQSSQRNSLQLRTSVELPISTNAFNNAPNGKPSSNALPEACLETQCGVHASESRQPRVPPPRRVGRSQSSRQVEISARHDENDDHVRPTQAGLGPRSKSAHHSADDIHGQYADDDDDRGVGIQDHDEIDEHANTAMSRRVHVAHDSRNVVSTFDQRAGSDRNGFQYFEAMTNWHTLESQRQPATAEPDVASRWCGQSQRHVQMLHALPDALQPIQEADSRETSGSQVNIELSTVLSKSSFLKTKLSRLRHESHNDVVENRVDEITAFDNSVSPANCESRRSRSQPPNSPQHAKLGVVPASPFGVQTGNRHSTNFRRSSSGYVSHRQSEKDPVYGPLGLVTFNRSRSLQTRVPDARRSSSGLVNAVNMDRFHSASGIGPRDSTQSSALYGRDSMHSIRSLPSIPSYLYPPDIDRPSQFSQCTDLSTDSMQLYSVYERHSLDVRRTASSGDEHHLHPQDCETGRLLKSTDETSGVVGDNKDPVTDLKPPQRNLWKTIASLPWEVVPFLLGMFILMEGLRQQGWIAIAANSLGHATAGGGLGGGTLLMGWLGTLLSNVVNNQPMTILLTSVCLDRAYTDALHVSSVETAHQILDSQTANANVTNTVTSTATSNTVPANESMLYQGALFAVVVGSNTGALFTLIGALAGIMWANIMKGMGVHIDYLRFLRIMLPLGLTATVSSLLVLWAQLAWMSP